MEGAAPPVLQREQSGSSSARASANSSNNNSPRSPFASPGRSSSSPGRKRSGTKEGGSMQAVQAESPNPDSPRFSSLKNVLAKFSPSIRRKKRTDSFVMDIQNSALEDFELLKELASGFIGRVYLTRHRTTKDCFALKVMSQEGIIAQRQLERVFNEKKIHSLLSQKNCYQVVKMYKTFRDEKNVYLIMDYQPADLFSLLNQMKRHVMPEADARFLTSVLVTALEAMHDLGVVYRDLKPQNVLIDELGYPMLTDFGFSKILNLKGKAEIPGLPPQTISFVGTPAYMAPELLKRKYYAEAVDWWALGILVYEVLLGDVPFDDHGGNYDKLLRDIDDGLQFPDQFPETARDFISRLLHRNPDLRLGAQGVQEVKAHPWLANVDWGNIQDRTAPSPLAPWIPKRGPQKEPDTRNFALYDLYEKPANQQFEAVSPRVLAELFEGY